ncbi:variable surface protein [Plasmodium gonderi]|uniref:Variable surface protein n=1 Tax=Plasmodium gonderi TaxID=77519 RepID=A0A1Y1JHL3_PLAGO|nr:variable surface protein [Plasmodium gonderi]GAW82011.1 variable surface protein [Plasmodium gonderi]
MWSTIYELAKKFRDFNDYVEKNEWQSSSSTDRHCENINQSYLQCIKNSDDNICPKFMHYVHKIKEQYNLKDPEYIYIYYWLYNQCNGKCESADIKNYFNELIKIYESEEGTTIYTVYKDIIITEVEFERLRDIYELNIKPSETDNNDHKKYCSEFQKIYMIRKSECDYNTHSEYCNTLEEYRNKYNEYVKSNNSLKSEFPILHPFRRYNILAYIYITFVIILAIALLLFIMYKFRKMSFFLHRKIIRKRNIYMSTDEGRNAFQYSEISNKISREGTYNILYNYDIC